jgi:LmbE family N-acetylglucosaminyl deacetylase
VVSPHLDDAVLSLGQFMAAEHVERVVTVFAGVIQGDALSAYDESCGFTTSREAMETRRAEDMAAMHVLDVPAVEHLSFRDVQYRSPRPFDECDKIAGTIAELVDPDVHTFVPLGIGHPDHALVTACTLATVRWGELLLYEELPYRVLHPEQVVAALDRVRWAGWNIDALPYPLPVGDCREKVAAINCYASQFPSTFEPMDPCLLVPERAWRCTR